MWAAKWIPAGLQSKLARFTLFSAHLQRMELILGENESFRLVHMNCDKLRGRSVLRIAQNGPEHAKQHFFGNLQKIENLPAAAAPLAGIVNLASGQLDREK